MQPPGVEDLTLAEHRRIVEAITAHDADDGAQSMREHLTQANAM